MFDEKFVAPGVLNRFRRMFGQKQRKNPARTFPAARPWLRLDRVYIRGFDVSAARVLQGAKWSKLSDHAPIVASLVLKKPREKNPETSTP